MATTAEELESFVEFARARLDTGERESSLEELFELWMHEHLSDPDYAENLAAIRGAIQDYQAGDRGRPAGELSRELWERLEDGEP